MPTEFEPTRYVYADRTDPRVVRLVATEGDGLEGFWRVTLPRIEAAGLIVADPADEATVMRVAGALTGEQFTGLTWGEIEIRARAVLAALAVKP